MDHLVNKICKLYKFISALYRSSSDRYTTRNGLLYYTDVIDVTPCAVVTAYYELDSRIINQCHDASTGDHRGRKKLTLRYFVTFTGPASIGLYACPFVIARFVNGCGSVLHLVHLNGIY